MSFINRFMNPKMYIKIVLGESAVGRKKTATLSLSLGFEMRKNDEGNSRSFRVSELVDSQCNFSLVSREYVRSTFV